MATVCAKHAVTVYSYVLNMINILHYYKLHAI